MTIDSHIASLVAGSCATGSLMMLAGLSKRALEPRRSRRLCPGCGRTLQSGRCSCTGT